jgi:YD repeat-containing protein
MTDYEVSSEKAFWQRTETACIPLSRPGDRQHGYDGVGLVAEGVVRYIYDDLGRTISYADDAGSTTTTAYDSLNRAVSVS